MKLNELKPPKDSTRKRKRVGRGEGSGWGKTCGRGAKGQKSRAGVSIPTWFEGGQMPLSRRMPKRGFNNPFRQEYHILNIESLNRFDDDTDVTPELLRNYGIIKKKNAKIKVLGDGKLTKRLTVQAHRFSKAAESKIIAAGGQAEEIR
ncbi:TPA: 50S ribosomal protein L15 [Candidatus Poribacteria bacterium]|nr:50S ribosomal protein L15 [Candidatus Poribacteria bacterium]